MSSYPAVYDPVYSGRGVRSYELTPTTAEVTDDTALEAVRDHLRIIHQDEDSYVLSSLVAALERFSTTTNRQLFTRGYRLALECFPYSSARAIKIPRWPLLAVSGITYDDTSVTEYTFEFDAFTDANTGTGEITIASHGLATDDRLIYYPASGGTALAPLADGTTYFAVVVDTNTIQLSATAGGSAIAAFTAAPGSSETHQLYHTPQKPWTALNAWKVQTDWNQIATVYPTEYPDNAENVLITFTCGYGTTWADVPVDCQRVVLLLAEHYFDNRQAIGPKMDMLPETITTLLNACSIGDEFETYGV